MQVIHRSRQKFEHSQYVGVYKIIRNWIRKPTCGQRYKAACRRDLKSFVAISIDLKLLPGASRQTTSGVRGGSSALAYFPSQIISVPSRCGHEAKAELALWHGNKAVHKGSQMRVANDEDKLE